MTPLEHLDALFGDQAGWVFVAAGTEPKLIATGKVKHDRWTEAPHRWPANADRIADVIAADPDADWYFTPSTSENPVRKLSATPKTGKLVCPGDRAGCVLESRALMMRRSSCQGDTPSSSAARCSI
jgi:hypothetical protein